MLYLYLEILLVFTMSWGQTHGIPYQDFGSSIKLNQETYLFEECPTYAALQEPNPSMIADVRVPAGYSTEIRATIDNHSLLQEQVALCSDKQVLRVSKETPFEHPCNLQDYEVSVSQDLILEKRPNQSIVNEFNFRQEICLEQCTTFKPQGVTLKMIASLSSQEFKSPMVYVNSTELNEAQDGSFPLTSPSISKRSKDFKKGDSLMSSLWIFGYKLSKSLLKIPVDWMNSTIQWCQESKGFHQVRQKAKSDPVVIHIKALPVDRETFENFQNELHANSSSCPIETYAAMTYQATPMLAPELTVMKLIFTGVLHVPYWWSCDDLDFTYWSWDLGLGTFNFDIHPVMQVFLQAFVSFVATYIYWCVLKKTMSRFSIFEHPKPNEELEEPEDPVKKFEDVSVIARRIYIQKFLLTSLVLLISLTSFYCYSLEETPLCFQQDLKVTLQEGMDTLQNAIEVSSGFFHSLKAHPLTSFGLSISCCAFMATVVFTLSGLTKFIARRVFELFFDYNLNEVFPIPQVSLEVIILYVFDRRFPGLAFVYFKMHLAVIRLKLYTLYLFLDNLTSRMLSFLHSLFTNAVHGLATLIRVCFFTLHSLCINVTYGFMTLLQACSFILRVICLFLETCHWFYIKLISLQSYIDFLCFAYPKILGGCTSLLDIFKSLVYSCFMSSRLLFENLVIKLAAMSRCCLPIVFTTCLFVALVMYKTYQIVYCSLLWLYDKLTSSKTYVDVLCSIFGYHTFVFALSKALFRLTLELLCIVLVIPWMLSCIVLLYSLKLKYFIRCHEKFKHMKSDVSKSLKTLFHHILEFIKIACHGVSKSLKTVFHHYLEFVKITCHLIECCLSLTFEMPKILLQSSFKFIHSILQAVLFLLFKLAENMSNLLLELTLLLSVLPEVLRSTLVILQIVCAVPIGVCCSIIHLAVSIGYVAFSKLQEMPGAAHVIISKLRELSRTIYDTSFTIIPICSTGLQRFGKSFPKTVVKTSQAFRNVCFKSYASIRVVLRKAYLQLCKLLRMSFLLPCLVFRTLYTTSALRLCTYSTACSNYLQERRWSFYGKQMDVVIFEVINSDGLLHTEDGTLCLPLDTPKAKETLTESVKAVKIKIEELESFQDFQKEYRPPNICTRE